MAKPQQVLILEPHNELAFKGPFTEYVNANLTLSNPSPRDVYFKVKTTAPKFYSVCPNSGVIQAKDKVQINVMLMPVESLEILENERNRHKFMIQSAFAQEGDQRPAVEQFWKSVDPAQIMESKLISVVFHQLEKLKVVEEKLKADEKAKLNIQTIQQKVDESAKRLTTKNAEYQKRKQELEIGKKLALQSVEERFQKEIGQLEAENWERNTDFSREMTCLKDELKEKINWDQVDRVMGKKLVVNLMVNRKANCWNLAKTKNKNSSISISMDGLTANNNSNATVYYNYKSVTADKGFYISADFSGPVLFYLEVTIMSTQYKGEILVGLSSGSIPDGTFVGELPNSYAIEDGCDHCWISEKTHQFECTTKPEWNGPGDIIGCGLVLNPAKELSLFFTANGILLGKQIPIVSAATSLYPTVSMYGFGHGSVVANFGDNPAKPFKFDIKKCPGIVFE